MSLELPVLRALLRLSRRRTPATPGELILRVEGDARAVRRAVASLERSGLVQRTLDGPRLTLAGFAVAVAVAATVAPAARTTPKNTSAARSNPRIATTSGNAGARGRVVPLVRRPAA